MSKKRKKNNENNLENSTVFNKTENANILSAEEIKQKKKRKTKIIALVSVLIIALIIGVPAIVIGVINAPNDEIINSGESVLTFQQRLDDTTASENAKELFDLKNPDLSDTESVEALISKLRPEDQLGSYTVSVQAAEKPYTVSFKFNSPHDMTVTDNDNLWKVDMIQYATVIMGLIDNVAQVNWEFPLDDGTTESSFFTRSDAKDFLKLGVNVDEFAKSPEGIQLLLNLNGIELY